MNTQAHTDKPKRLDEARVAQFARDGYTMRYMPSHVRLSDNAGKVHQVYLARGRDRGGGRYADPEQAYPKLARYREEAGAGGH